MAHTSTIGGKINPDKGKPGTPLRLTVRFTIDPDSGQTPGTLTRIVVQLPPNGVQNAKFFPTCNAAFINSRKSYSKCPKKSFIGKGRLRADIPAIDTPNVPADVTFFNGSRDGKKVTIHVWAIRPARVNLAFDATLVRTRGRYGYKLTAPVPQGLQEISPGWFPAVRTFESTLFQTIKVGGKTRGYIEAKRCPKAHRVPVAGAFNFRDGGSTSSQGWISCRT